MKRLFIRLDDACPKRDADRWDRIEKLLDKYGIKPLVGIIPNCKDPDMDKYLEDEKFWSIKVLDWKEKGWTFALHGYEHIFNTESGGINPINNRSEFAGLPYEVQSKKIRQGYIMLKERGIDPTVFFAPAHTFDENTLKALAVETPIRIISDTIANDAYYKYPFYYIPQQSGRVRSLPFRTITFCYHPNIMKDKDFKILEQFIKNNQDLFLHKYGEQKKRELNVYDMILRYYYFAVRKIRSITLK